MITSVEQAVVPDCPKAVNAGANSDAGAVDAAFAMLLNQHYATALPGSQGPAPEQAGTDAPAAAANPAGQQPTDSAPAKPLPQNQETTAGSGKQEDRLMPNQAAAPAARAAGVAGAIAGVPHADQQRSEGAQEGLAERPATGPEGVPAVEANTANRSAGQALTSSAHVADQEAPANAGVLPGAVRNQEKTAATEKAGERKPESAPTAGGKEGQAALAREPREADNNAGGKEARPAKHGVEDRSAPQQASDPRQGSGSLPRGAAPAGQVDGDARLALGAQNVSAPAGPGQAVTSPQEQSAFQHPAVHAAAQPTNKAEVHAPLPQQAANPAELMDRTVSVVRDGNRLSVQIEPGGLGKIDISLSLEQGLVSARISVADHATRNLLENNMQQIVEALQREGVSVGGFSVALKQHGTGEETPGHRQDGVRQGRGDAPPEASGAEHAAIRGRVNIFV